MGSEDGVHVHRRHPRHVHKLVVLDEAQSSQGITDNS